MEKLLFFTKMNFAVKGSGGIQNKIFAQAKAFEQLGIKTDILYFEDDKIYLKSDETNLLSQINSKFGFLKYIYGGFLKDIKIQHYKYLFVRHFLTNPLFIWLLFRIKLANPNIVIFMEIPTFPYKFEFGLMTLKKRLEQKLDEFCTYFFRFFIDRIVTFSSKTKIFGIPTIQTDNGIDIEKFGLTNRPAFDGINLHLLGLANVQPWHGLDRVIKGLQTYYKRENHINVIFDVVGSGDELPNLENLTKSLSLEKHVRFHGFVSGKELLEIYEKSHIGIGSLGMHRINVAKGETSALKSREYAARGIPFVIAYLDRGFPENFPFLLNLEANDNPIDIQQIVDFYTRCLQEKDYPEIMHRFAKDNLTWNAKLKPVAEALKNAKKSSNSDTHL
jgi:glycosyltransferase involved in cell wall biosynthesis